MADGHKISSSHDWNRPQVTNRLQSLSNACSQSPLPLMSVGFASNHYHIIAVLQLHRTQAAPQDREECGPKGSIRAVDDATTTGA
jgi:hypothetical protein